jgi:effector-binding domain-containing protein
VRSGAALAVLAAALLAGCRTIPGPDAAPEPGAPLAVEVREVPATTVLTRTYVGPYAQAEARFEEFVRHLLTSGVAPVGDLAGVYYDDPAAVPPEETRYEIRIPVAEGTTASPPYRTYRAPAFRAAAVRLTGSYGEISRRYGELYAWIRENGFRAAGPLVEIYLVHAGSGVPPERYETEVMVPVEPVAG